MKTLKDYIGETIYVYAYNPIGGFRETMGVVDKVDRTLTIKIDNEYEYERFCLPGRIKAGEVFMFYVWYPEPSYMTALLALAEKKIDTARDFVKRADNLNQEARALMDIFKNNAKEMGWPDE